MIDMQTWMELVDYKITEGSNYTWRCYGLNTYSLDSWNGKHDDGGVSLHITFDTKNQTVFETTVCDYSNNRAYRMIHPDYVKKHKKESKLHNVNADRAWDDINWIDLDLEEDFLEKARAIIAGEDYDSRVQISVELPADDLFQYMQLAHEQDVTLNQWMEDAIRSMLARIESGELTKKDLKKLVKANEL